MLQITIPTTNTIIEYYRRTQEGPRRRTEEEDRGGGPRRAQNQIRGKLGFSIILARGGGPKLFRCSDYSHTVDPYLGMSYILGTPGIERRALS